MLHVALEYAAARWSVFPLHGKMPFPGTHGHLDASTDPDVIRSWWQRWPGANIGAPVPVSALVLDVDPRNGGTVASLGELPETLVCVSGRGDGGRHYYFRRPVGRLTSTRLPQGIDLKCSGYMVMPPSLHPATGRPYRWVAMTPAASLPPHLRDLLRAPEPTPRPMVRRGDGRGLVGYLRRFPQQGINNALSWAAYVAAKEGTLDALAPELVAVAVELGESERQAWATVESARRAGTGVIA